jgi:hypothetical protein
MDGLPLPPHVIGEQMIVAQKLPRGTRLLGVDDIYGWLYPIVNELGDRYTMFVYHDGSGYSVEVVEPEVEGRYSPHHGHLFSDGRICFGTTGSTLPSLELAYAKSVLWANGFSIFRRTGTFPFSATYWQAPYVPPDLPFP